jgi:transposase
MRGMARPIKMLSASDDDRAELQRRANGRATEHRDRFRAKIIPLRLDGLKIEDVAERSNTSMRTVSIWSSRFERHPQPYRGRHSPHERHRSEAAVRRERGRVPGTVDQRIHQQLERRHRVRDAEAV